MNNSPNNLCQWIGPDADSARLKPSCCAPALAARSYCAEHIWRVYQEGTAVRRKKDARRAQAIWDLESAFNEAVQELVEEGEI